MSPNASRATGISLIRTWNGSSDRRKKNLAPSYVSRVLPISRIGTGVIHLRDKTLDHFRVTARIKAGVNRDAAIIFLQKYDVIVWQRDLVVFLKSQDFLLARRRHCICGVFHLFIHFSSAPSGIRRGSNLLKVFIWRALTEIFGLSIALDIEFDI